MRNNILSTIIILILIIILCGGGYFVKRALPWLIGPHSGSDTTIVINNYYDTTIYKVEVKNVTQKHSYYYKEYDTSLVVYQGMCDTVHTYDVTAGNDTIQIVGGITTLGILLDQEFSYRWLLPYKTEEIKTIHSWRSGPIIGADLKVPFAVGIHAGWQNKNGLEYSAGYFTDKSILFSVEKVFNFDLTKAKGRKRNRTINGM